MFDGIKVRLSRLKIDYLNLTILEKNYFRSPTFMKFVQEANKEGFNILNLNIISQSGGNRCYTD